MACGACGGRAANTEYEVTLPDGSKEIVPDLPSVRLLRAQHQAPGVRALTYRAVPKKH